MSVNGCHRMRRRYSGPPSSKWSGIEVPIAFGIAIVISVAIMVFA